MRLQHRAPLRHRPSRALALVALGAVALAAGCSGDDEPSSVASAGAEPTGVVVDVLALDNTFRPERIEISAGDTVRWENRGRNDHDVEPTEGGDWGVAIADFAPGDVYEHTFTEPGEYPYLCTIHAVGDQGMVGTVVVTED